MSEPLLRVLLVDDNDLQRHLMQIILEDAGVGVGLAPNGEEALRLASAQAFDAVVLDIEMPPISGFETAIRLTRTMPRYTGRLLMLSSQVQPQHVAKAKELGITAYLTKPVDTEKLVSTLKLLVAQAGIEAA
jgi:CheY-like chemotaxis protein